MPDRRRLPRTLGVIVAFCLAMAGLTAQSAQAADTGKLTGAVFTQTVGGVKTAATDVYIYLSYSATVDGGYSSVDSDPSTPGTNGYSFPGSTFELSGLKAGFYKFEVAGVADAGTVEFQREYYNDADSLGGATSLQVGAGTTTAADMVLEPAGQITGKVTDRNGNPLPNASVSFQDSDRGGSAFATTDASGNFTSATDPAEGFGAGLVRGDYRVSANLYNYANPDAPSYEERYWQNSSTYEGATPVTVVPGQTKGQINIVLDVAPRIRLTVKDPAGTPLPNVDVGIYTFYQGAWGPYQAGPNTTDADGVFRKTVRIGDRYKFFITPPAGVGGVKEWYDNAYTEATAKEVKATAYGDILNLTIQLGPAPETPGTPGEPSAPVIAGATPSISGTARSGKTLTVNPGNWGPAGVAVAYQWLANGVAIPGATGPSFKLMNSQAGKKISVMATGSLAGAAPVAATSATTATVLGVLTAKKVSISGTAKVGKKLRAKTSAWGPSPVTSSYTWYRNGKKISGQKSSTYKLRKADAGKRVTVRVTQKKSNYVSVSKLSSKTKKIKK